MKKLFLVLVLLSVSLTFVFGDNGEHFEDDSFNWWWLLLLLLPLFLLLWPKRKNKKLVKTPMQKFVTEPKNGESKYYRLTEEEIRNLAYKLYEKRNQQHGYDETDWHNAIGQLFAKYEAQGYIVLWS